MQTRLYQRPAICVVSFCRLSVIVFGRVNQWQLRQVCRAVRKEVCTGPGSLPKDWAASLDISFGRQSASG